MDRQERSQQTIQGRGTSHPSAAWGDVLRRKEQNICRIGLLNPTGFTVRSGSAKDDQLRKFIEESEVDIMAFPEVNVCWH
jgi:hypothetical protein